MPTSLACLDLHKDLATQPWVNINHAPPQFSAADARSKPFEIGWPSEANFRPNAITLHWSGTDPCHIDHASIHYARLLDRSTHYLVGPSLAQGTRALVFPMNRAWHSTTNQTTDHLGRPLTNRNLKASRQSLALTLCHPGHQRVGISKPYKDLRQHGIEPLRYIPHSNCRPSLTIAPYPEEQVRMASHIVRAIRTHFPHIEPTRIHLHADLCPSYRHDPIGFPLAILIQQAYDTPIPDVFHLFSSPFNRSRFLAWLVKPVGMTIFQPQWSERHRSTLREFLAMSEDARDSLQATFPFPWQLPHAHNNGYWTTFTSWLALAWMYKKDIGFFEHLQYKGKWW